MLEITTLASGSTGNAYIIDNGESKLLLEAGISIQKLREASGFQLHSLNGALISHEHGDHAKAASDLMWAGVDVYMTEGTAGQLQLPRGHRLHRVEAYKETQIGPWTVMPFEAVHDAAEPVGFLLTTSVNKIVFLTDSRYSHYYFNGVTHFLIEANHSRELLLENRREEILHETQAKRVLWHHMSIEAVMRFLEACDLSKTEEIHLIHMSGDNSEPQDFVRQVQREIGIPTYAAGR